MGGKDSKLSYISQEEVLRRVTDVELKRLKDAFKRVSPISGFMTENVFIKEVLWDGVPPKIAQLIFHSFGGTSKGLLFRELLAGMVVLTKGTKEEKIRMIFRMYADDTFTYIQKDVMDRIIVATEENIPPALSDLFAESDQVYYEQFRNWVYLHPDATTVTKWLLMEPIAFSLSNDTDTPTFYQTLAGVTHLEETDISELEKRYWNLKGQSKTGKFDLDTFTSLVNPPMPHSLCESIFAAFDENRDSHIDFKEIACGVSACCRGPILERQKFCFKIFDTNHDGKLSYKELQEMVDVLIAIMMDNHSHNELENDLYLKMDPAIAAQQILTVYDTDQDGCIMMPEYLVWTVNNKLSDIFLDLLSQICHVVLGLRPQTPEEEGKIITDWLNREERKMKKVGQTWYLISIQWWNTWSSYVSNKQPAEEHDVMVEGHSLYGSDDVHCNSQTKDKSSSVCLPWDDGNVIMVNLNKANVVCEMPLVGDSRLVPNHYSSHTFPQMSNSETSSPKKFRLLPESEQKTRTLGILPKFKRNIEKPPKPGQIDNSSLVIPNPYKVMTLTNEGGRLKRDVMMVDGKDFKLVPEPVWKSLCTWYGGMPALPRTVVLTGKKDVSPEVEFYPIMVKLLRHQAPHQWPVQTTTFSSMMTGIGGMAINTVSSLANSHHQQPKRYLMYTACFSKCHLLQQVYDFLCNKLRFTREDMRLWKISSKDENAMTLLDDDNQTVEQTGIEEGQQLLIEIRNKDLTWPEEMSQLAKNKTMKKEQVPTEPGATGLNNLGNTCFMNAAVQCVSNTRPLTQYFTSGYHLYEINRTNPLGMKGHIAQQYGDLVKDIWSGTMKTTAPLKLRWIIGKYAPRFNGFQQHDSQELLSFLLDGLHEDLNRVQDKPYIELKDSNGRPDEIVAQEAWDNHLLRNQSVIVDLFHGQLKSQVRCKECGNVSVRFDPFNYLSLPLPMESCIHLEIIVMKLDGSIPVKYGLRLNMNDKYKLLKKELSSLTNIPPEQILLVEIMGPIVKALPHDNQKVQDFIAGTLYAYELPPVEDIEPITVEEETKERKASLGLSEIQRGISAKKLASNGHILRLQNTIMDIDRNGTGSTPNSPLHSCHNSSTSLNTSVNGSCGSDLQKAVRDIFNGFVITVHRKMMLMDLYFLSSQKTRPSLFGTPIILPCDEKSTNQYLYEFIWKQVARIVSPLPPSESQSSNHALDCDDSLCYEYPFTLKVVQKDGITCARCPWYRFCRGCSIKCNTDKINFSSSFIAVDWEPTALHLRYQTTCERFFEEHSSVADSRRKQTEPIDLDTCLQAFVKEEELDEDELYYCSKCKKHCLASKKLDIWRLPPILIVNLKRFQFLNGKWVKSHKIVNFPLVDFDPSCYLAPRKHSLCICGKHGDQIIIDYNGNGPTVPNGRDSHSVNSCDKTNPGSVSPSRRKVGENLNIEHSGAVKNEHNTEMEHTSNSGCEHDANIEDSIINCYEHNADSTHVSENGYKHDADIEDSIVICYEHNADSMHVSENGYKHDADIEDSIVICYEHNADSTHVSENGYKHDADIEDAAVKGYKHDTDFKDGAVKGNECDVDLKAASVNGYKHDANIEHANVNGYEHEADIHHASANGYDHNVDIEFTNVHEFSHITDNFSLTGNKYNAKNADDAHNQCFNNNRRTMCCHSNCIMSNSCHSNNNTTCKQLESMQSKYDLFAMSCHTGILGGGHYVAFAKNPNNKWYCYNDSSCKEVQEKQLDTNAAYILFYQRKDINYNSFMPEIQGKVPDTQEIDDEFESDFKKLCVVQ